MAAPEAPAPAPAPRLRRPLTRRRKIQFAALTFFLLLLLLEGVSRVVCHFRFARWGSDIAIQGGGRWIDHPVYGWDNRPWYILNGLPEQFNEYGMRVPLGQVRMPEKGEKDFWVFLFGGSVMFGAGSLKEDEYPYLTGVSDHPGERSIQGYLEKALQEAMPERQVHVFNAAVASHSLVHCRLKYEWLRHLRPDWVISMDCVNDPKRLPADGNSLRWIHDQWRAHSRNRFPLAQAIWLMSRSALCFLAGEYLYFHTRLMGAGADFRQDPAVLKRWLEDDRARLETGEPDAELRRAADEFFRNLRAFRETLRADGQRHLLLVQPHLGQRQADKLPPEEKACRNLMLSLSGGRPCEMFDVVYREFPARFGADEDVFTMDAVQRWDGWVFVDHAHFTADANRRIAEEMKQYILSDGEYRPFR